MKLAAARKQKPLVALWRSLLIFGLPVATFLLGAMLHTRGSIAGLVMAENREPCRSKALLPFPAREYIGRLLEQEGFTTGAELGVQTGAFSRVTLENWHSCQKFLLVDIWRQQTNYRDSANVPDDAQDALMREAQKQLAPYANVTEFMRMFTSEAAAKVPNASLDYVYVDARHDYCGCLEDMVQWWPKIKPGGIMAGHDFIDAAGAHAVAPQEDWFICADGSRNEGAVKGAVQDFATSHGLAVTVAYQEDGNPWKSWMMRKPVQC